MRRFNITNINTDKYWDTHQTAIDFGLRQEKYLKLARSGNTILEIGCGLSPFLNRARDTFSFVFGCDFSKKTLEKAHELYPEVIYFRANAEDLDKLTCKFDVVVAGEIIEHLENPLKFLDNLERIGKRVVLSTPILEFQDPEHLWEFDEQFFQKKGYKTEVVSSSRFIGRKYIFAWKKI